MSRQFILIYVVLAAALLSWSCTNHGNRFDTVVERLLYHYNHEDVNPLKVEAVRYFAENIQWHNLLEGDSLIADKDVISYDFLREHIDYIFGVWKSSPYCKNLDFEDFKKYLLPYTAFDGIGPHLTAKERGEWMIKNGILCDTASVWEIVKRYNRIVCTLRDQKQGGSQGRRIGLADLCDTVFIDCGDKAHHCVLNLRSIGIPCIAESNFCYRKLMGYHVHCAIYVPEDKQFYRFNAEDTLSIPESNGWDFVEMQNIYRLTYEKQYDSPHFLKQLKEKTIYPFNSPCFKEVTRKSWPADIAIRTDNSHNMVYLATFNRNPLGMMPVTWGMINPDHTSASFNHVLPSTLYFPGISDNGHFCPIAPPIYLTIQGDSLICHNADFTFQNKREKKQRIVVNRKYPIKETTYEVINALKGSVVEASDSRDFTNSQVLAVLNAPLRPERQMISINSERGYRYYRLASPPGTNAEVSVLKWIDCDNTGHIGNKDNPAYDDNMTTAPNNGRYISVEFDDPVNIQAIEIAPKNANNGVKAGHRYRLSYYNPRVGHWDIISEITATNSEIEFENVPNSVLLWLADLTDGFEEMPFIYSDGQQLFLYPDLITPLP